MQRALDGDLLTFQYLERILQGIDLLLAALQTRLRSLHAWPTVLLQLGHGFFEEPEVLLPRLLVSFGCGELALALGAGGLGLGKVVRRLVRRLLHLVLDGQREVLEVARIGKRCLVQLIDLDHGLLDELVSLHAIVKPAACSRGRPLEEQQRPTTSTALSALAGGRPVALKQERLTVHFAKFTHNDRDLRHDVISLLVVFDRPMYALCLEIMILLSLRSSLAQPSYLHLKERHFLRQPCDGSLGPANLSPKGVKGILRLNAIVEVLAPAVGAPLVALCVFIGLLAHGGDEALDHLHHVVKGPGSGAGLLEHLRTCRWRSGLGERRGVPLPRRGLPARGAAPEPGAHGLPHRACNAAVPGVTSTPSTSAQLYEAD
mmetsp:Transcript_49220/g.157424  ORF Transcript_49220/g.157424 Transcript_49220/m.157424 type:complete len:374 (+) Transcript_49220:276-1397(+)